MLPVRSLPDIRRRIRCKTSNLNYPGPRSAKKQDRQKTHTGCGLALGNDRPTAKSWAAHGQRVCGQINDWGAQDYSESVSQSVLQSCQHRAPSSFAGFARFPANAPTPPRRNPLPTLFTPYLTLLFHKCRLTIAPNPIQLLIRGSSVHPRT